MIRFLAAHPAATLIAALLGVCSIGYVWAPSLGPWLVLSTGEGTAPYPFAILTNGFVDIGRSVFGFFILVFLGAYFYQAHLRRLWRVSPARLVVQGLAIFLLLQLAHHLLLNGRGWGLFSALGVALWIGSALEDRWGTSRLLSFSSIILLITQGIGLLMLWAVPTAREQYVAGAHPLFNAWMTALCVTYGRNRIAGLNVTAKSLIWVLVALDGLGLVLDMSLMSFMGLVGILVSWLMMTGRWHPAGLVDMVRLYLLKQRVRRQRSRFRIIDGKKKE